MQAMFHRIWKSGYKVMCSLVFLFLNTTSMYQEEKKTEFDFLEIFSWIFKKISKKDIRLHKLWDTYIC